MALEFELRSMYTKPKLLTTGSTESAEDQIRAPIGDVKGRFCGVTVCFTEKIVKPSGGGVMFSICFNNFKGSQEILYWFFLHGVEGELQSWCSLLSLRFFTIWATRETLLLLKKEINNSDVIDYCFHISSTCISVQAGFREGRGTRDQIANIWWIIEKSRAFQKNIYFCFIDYTKAFDCVNHNTLWKILQEMGILDHLTCLLRNLYAGEEATVRTGHGTADCFQIGKGVCQGCILSPCLFNLYAEYIMRNAWLDEVQAGIKISGRNINNLICRWHHCFSRKWRTKEPLDESERGEWKSLLKT